MTQIQLEILTPQRTIIDALVDKIVIPGIEGEMCVLPEHVPLLTVMDSGVLSYNLNGTINSIAVHEGYAQVDDKSVRILAELAEKPDEIDIERAKEAEKKAKSKLMISNKNSGSKDGDNEQKKYERKLKRAIIRQRLAQII